MSIKSWRVKTMFKGQVVSPKRINLLYDYVERHYHVFVNINGAMAKKYVFNTCNNSCASEDTHRCDQKCSDCMASTRAPSPTSEYPAPSVIDI